MIQVPKIFVGAFCVLCPLLNLLSFGSEYSPVINGARGAVSSLEISSLSPAQTTIALHAPNIRMINAIQGYEVMQSFSLDGEGVLPDEGSPTVPQVFRFYRIPETGGVELVIRQAEYDIVDHVYPQPFQMDSTTGRERVRDDDIYQSDEWYPPHIAQMTSPMILRDFRVVGVTLFPVQVNPVTHQARIYRNLEVEVVANGEPGINEITQARRPSGEWAPVYREYIANLDDHALDEVTRTPGSILILTSSAIPHPWADSLFEWKTRKGYKVSVDARSNWTSASAVIAIRTAYASWNPPLEYVILMGDPGSTGGIPTNSEAFDHSYALGNSGDDLEDIAVGRLSGSTTAEMATINAKIMQYERTPHMETSTGNPDTNWFHKAFLYAGIARACAGNYLLMSWGQQQFQRHTGVDSIALLTHSSDAVNMPQVLERLNGGVSYFIWRGTWIGGMPTYVPAQTNPGGRLPITMTMECSTGDFQNSGANSLSEAFLCAGTPSNPKGGVCGIGMATAGSQNPGNVTLTGGFIYNVANLGVEHLGTALAGAKRELYRTYGVSDDWQTALNHSRWCNLMGDPSLALWTDVPESLLVTHPTEIDVGTRTIDVTVRRAADSANVVDALVVLWKRGADSTWVSGLTNAEGHITFPVAVNEYGDMYLTVTKRNCVPYLYTIPCSRQVVTLNASSYWIDDDQTGGTEGNGNGILNPGETIDLPVYIQNFGDATYALGISATLTTSDPRVTIIQGMSTYPTLDPGDSALGTVPFRIHANSSLHNLDRILFTLTINSSAGQFSGLIPLTGQAGELHYVRRYYTDEFEPGGIVNIIVVLANTGSQSRQGVTGHLISLSPWLSIPDADAVFGDIPAGTLDSNQTDWFTLHASALMYRGQQADMLLTLTGSDGSVDTVSFAIVVGVRTDNDPAGPDAYGYFAYDNTDTTYELHPEFNYVNIAGTGGTTLILNDAGEKTTPFPVYSTVRRLPFGFKYYGQVYDSITICSNGWCALGDQSYLDMFRNYPIPGIGAPDAMIAPYWDDLATMGSNFGVWVKNDTTNHRYIIQWKAGVGASYATPLDFEVILYDTTYLSTDDGNGRILIQYNQVTMNVANGSSDEGSGSTVGIQAPGCLVGLNYAYQNTYAAGAAEIENGRAILFTTMSRQGLGSVLGQILDSSTDLPIAGAEITLDGSDSVIFSGIDGGYRFDLLPSGLHSLEVGAHRYNSRSLIFSIIVDSALTLDVSLTHPELSIPTDTLRFTLGAQVLDTNVQVLNIGNGPLTCDIRWNPDELMTFQLGDPIDTISWSGLGSGRILQGCEFAGGRWWIAAGGLSGRPNLLYRLDPHGVLLDSLVQPSTTAVGWSDLVYDGHFIYGSDGSDLIGLDMSGVERTRITSILNPVRAMTYDIQTDHFWVANENSSFLELDRGGNVIRMIERIPADSMTVTGLAWFAQDGFNLYIFGRNSWNTECRVIRINPVTYERQEMNQFQFSGGVMAGGCTITDRWSTMQVVFGAIQRNGAGGQLNLYHLAMNPALVQISPSMLTIPEQGAAPINLRVNPALLLPAHYRFNLYLHSDIEDTTLSLPVSLNILDLAVEDPPHSALPKTYRLYQNYPNPFNPLTEIRYELPEAAHVRLTVFNTLGQRIITLVDGFHSQGVYQIVWDGKDTNGWPVANGMYIYQITAGDFSSAKKMLLLK